MHPQQRVVRKMCFHGAKSTNPITYIGARLVNSTDTSPHKFVYNRRIKIRFLEVLLERMANQILNTSSRGHLRFRLLIDRERVGPKIISISDIVSP